MIKIKYLFLVWVAAIAFTAMFASSVAFAFYDNFEPEGDLPISTAIGNKYTITLESIEESPVNPKWYRWTYKLTNKNNTNKLTGLNFFAMLIPDCMNGPEISITDDSFGSLQQFGVAEGENVLNFGRFIEHGYVIKGTSDGSIFWSFDANTMTKTNTTALLKYGGNAGSGEIPGPGCTPIENCPKPKYSSDTVQTIKFVNLGGDQIEVRYTYDLVKGCIEAVDYRTSSNGSWIPAEDVTTTVDSGDGDELIVDCGDTEGNQYCRTCEFTTERNPTCRYIVSGGTRYRICL